MIALIHGHIATKVRAIRALLAGKPRAARVLWRWMANRPTSADLVLARAALCRPRVRAELARLNGEWQ